MAYTKTTWEAQTPISPSRLNNLETQYDEFVSYLNANSPRVASAEDMVVEVLSSAPTHSDGRMYFNTTSKELNLSNGTAWTSIVWGRFS